METKTSSSKGAGELFTKALRKQSLRAKERVLEKLGKLDKTQDELFDEYVTSISRQQNNVLKLQKEVKNYLQCVKAMTAASQSLNSVIAEIYEPDWSGQTELQSVENQLQLIRSDRLKILSDELTNNLLQYQAQFPDAMTKIAKRNRKLLDFDAARYALSAVVNNPKKNDIKIAKAQDEVSSSQKMYESVNDELHRELPALYESRIGFYGSILKLLWETETVYHKESARCCESLQRSAEKLAEHGGGSFRFTPIIRKQVSISNPMPTETVVSPSEEPQVSKGKENGASRMSVHYQPKISSEAGTIEEEVVIIRESSPSQKPAGSPPPIPAERASVRMYPELPTKADDKIIETRIIRTRRSSSGSSDEENQGGSHNSTDGNPVVRVSDDCQATRAAEDSTSSKVNSSLLKNAPVVLYKVRATNPYSAEDSDELSFDAGEIIRVIPYGNPEDQDEGWLMGIKESDGECGVFPANFTKPITH